MFVRIGSLGTAPPLYLHSVPTSSDDWTPFLERTGGIAPDLPGFGRSGKAGNLDYSLHGLARFVGELLDALQLNEVKLVGHGWGAAVGLVLAQREPGRVQRIVLVDPVPLLDGFRWPAVARLWRRPGVGELAMGATGKWLLARALRRGSVSPQAWPSDRIEAVWEQFDQGTQRAILRLHRSVDEQRLIAAGAGLGALAVPALVLWGERDPWLPASFAHRYAERLGQATPIRLADAGHWPWLDQRSVIDRVDQFLASG